MAKPRKEVSRQIKRALKREAGDKCANPGCINYRTHNHHIRGWAVWETNDQEHMVALCPTCHDAVHHGPLQITDEKIYRWKSIKRFPTKRDHIYVEPGENHMLALGSIGFTGVSGASIFEPSPMNRLDYRLKDQDIFLMNLDLATRSGRELIRIVDGYVKCDVQDPVCYERVPGHIRLTTPVTPNLAPDWVLKQIRAVEFDYGEDVLTLLDVEVLEPGLVRIQGIWSYEQHLIIATREYLHLCHPSLLRPISIIGSAYEGIRPQSIFVWDGPIGGSFFKFGEGAQNSQ